MAGFVSSGESVDRLELSHRKIGTSYTEIVHRFRLHPIKPQNQITDKDDIKYENFQTDPTLGYYRGEQDFFDNNLPRLLETDRTVPENKTPNSDSPFRVSILFGVQTQQPLEQPPQDLNNLEEHLHHLSSSRHNYLNLLKNLTNMLKSLQQRDAQ